MSPTDRDEPNPVRQAAEVFLDHDGARERAHEIPPAMLRGMREVWDATGGLANTPEIRVLREQALARARRASIKRWKLPMDASGRAWRRVAVAAGLVIALAAAWQFSPWGFTPGTYHTGIGEQRMVELDDQSRLFLDAGTRLRVEFSDDARLIEFDTGQVQFSVAKDAERPFRVRVGRHTFVALGTAFTLDQLGDTVSLTMLEGRVALIESDLELDAGQGVRIAGDGAPQFLARADLEAAMAWRQGKVVFHNEPLGQAVQRMNRYSRLQLQVEDGWLATLKVSGVFEAGDARGFLEVIRAYLPLKVEEVRQDLIRLRGVGNVPTRALSTD